MLRAIFNVLGAVSLVSAFVLILSAEFLLALGGAITGLVFLGLAQLVETLSRGAEAQQQMRDVLLRQAAPAPRSHAVDTDPAPAALSPSPEEIEREAALLLRRRVTAARRARIESELAVMRTSGIAQAQIVGQGRLCSVCRGLHMRIVALDLVPELPPPACDAQPPCVFHVRAAG